MKKNCIKTLALIPAAVLLVGCGRVTIDPNDYLEVKYDGMDTRGTATYDIDFEKMVTDNLKAFGIESKKSDDVLCPVSLTQGTHIHTLVALGESLTLGVA